MPVTLSISCIMFANPNTFVLITMENNNKQTYATNLPKRRLMTTCIKLLSIIKYCERSFTG